MPPEVFLEQFMHISKSSSLRFQCKYRYIFLGSRVKIVMTFKEAPHPKTLKRHSLQSAVPGLLRRVFSWARKGEGGGARLEAQCYLSLALCDCLGDREAGLGAALVCPRTFPHTQTRGCSGFCFLEFKQNPDLEAGAQSAG